jgi:hypothetical protein
MVLTWLIRLLATSLYGLAAGHRYPPTWYGHLAAVVAQDLLLRYGRRWASRALVQAMRDQHPLPH